MTRAIDCVTVKADGGVEVSCAAANTFRFGRAMVGNCEWLVAESLARDSWQEGQISRSLFKNNPSTFPNSFGV